MIITTTHSGGLSASLSLGRQTAAVRPLIKTLTCCPRHVQTGMAPESKPLPLAPSYRKIALPYKSWTIVANHEKGFGLPSLTMVRLVPSLFTSAPNLSSV